MRIGNDVCSLFDDYLDFILFSFIELSYIILFYFFYCYYKFCKGIYCFINRYLGREV